MEPEEELEDNAKKRTSASIEKLVPACSAMSLHSTNAQLIIVQTGVGCGLSSFMLPFLLQPLFTQSVFVGNTYFIMMSFPQLDDVANPLKKIHSMLNLAPKYPLRASQTCY
jgi:hypothetical protein